MAQNMVSEFDFILEKIHQLAQLTATLKKENHELRQENLELKANVRELSEKLDDAGDKISKLIDSLNQQNKVETVNDSN